ncbi:hypothetical protein A6R68_13888, partial [Neotoma lepida]
MYAKTGCYLPNERVKDASAVHLIMVENKESMMDIIAPNIYINTH